MKWHTRVQGIVCSLVRGPGGGCFRSYLPSSRTAAEKQQHPSSLYVNPVEQCVNALMWSLTDLPCSLPIKRQQKGRTPLCTGAMGRTLALGWRDQSPGFLARTPRRGILETKWRETVDKRELKKGNLLICI